MASFSVDNIRAALTKGGARPTLFEVKVGSTDFTEDHSYMVRSAQLPGTNLNVLPINWRGRPLKLAGARTFDPWTMTMMNDEGSFRSYIVDYIKEMSGSEDGTRDANAGSYSSGDYINLTVKQLHKDGKSDSNIYTLVNAFPLSLGDISLDWGTEGFQEYTVTWRYDYFTIGSTDITVKSSNLTS
tara:strand:+ start:2844 stop:3398 length:555 start_codon:yes stop_codon:yes gene_type:complete